MPGVRWRIVSGALAVAGAIAPVSARAATPRPACYPIPLGIAAARVPAGSYLSQLLPTLLASDGTPRSVPVLCSRPATVHFDPTRPSVDDPRHVVGVVWRIWRRGRVLGTARDAACSSGCRLRVTIRLRGARLYTSLLGRVRVYTTAHVRRAGARGGGRPAFLPRPTAALADARLSPADVAALADLVRAGGPVEAAAAPLIDGQRSVIDGSFAWIRAGGRGVPVVSGIVRIVDGTWFAPFGLGGRCAGTWPSDLARLCAPRCPGPVAREGAGGGSRPGLLPDALVPTRLGAGGDRIACPLVDGTERGRTVTDSG